MEAKKDPGICREFILIMQASLDGAAPAEEEKALQSHMEHCESCRTLYRELREIKKAVASAAAEPPSNLKEQVLERLKRENRSLSVEKVRKNKSRKRIIGFVLGAAALLTLGFVGIDKLGFLRAGSLTSKSADSMELQSFAPAAEDALPEAYLEENKSAVMTGMTGGEAGSDAFPGGDGAIDEEELESESAVPPTAAETAPREEGESESESGEDMDPHLDLREWALMRVEGILEASDVTGAYNEVIYLQVDRFPHVDALYFDGYGGVGVYETEDYADFVTANEIRATGIQYELTPEEIAESILYHAGKKTLLILERPS